MGNSKIVYATKTLVDITGDTVTAETLAEGVTAHGADGEPIVGTYIGLDTSNATAAATDIAQGKTAYVNGEKVTGIVTVKDDGVLDPADQVTVTVYNGGEVTTSPTTTVASSVTAFTNIGNIATDDDTYATITLKPATGVGSITTSVTSYVQLAGFDFGNILTSAKISKVTLIIKYRCSTTSIASMKAGLYGNTESISVSDTTETVTLEFSDLDISPDDLIVYFGATNNKTSSTYAVYIYYIGLHIVAQDTYDVQVEKLFDKSSMIVAGNYYGLTASTSSAETGSGSQAGTDTSDATATAADILSGKTAYVNGEKITGEIATATAPTPTISVSTTGLITASVSNPKGYQSSATTKSATKQLTTQAATTYTPGTSNQTIASGQYLTGAQTIKGDENLAAGNIKSGVSIFGIAGSYTGSGSGGNSDYNCEAQTIADVTAPAANFRTTSGTLKVWGYGRGTTSGYTTPVYSFCGDGYYASSLYGTPTKTSLMLSIDSNGDISGLPSLQSGELIVTRGI